MPLYEYEYTNRAGEPVRLERRFPMGEAPDSIEIPVKGEGPDAELGCVKVTARRVPVSMTAKMASRWTA